MNLWYILEVEETESQILIFIPLSNGTWGITDKRKIKHYFITSLATSLQIPKYLPWKNWVEAILRAQGYIGSLIPLPSPLHQFEIAGRSLPPKLHDVRDKHGGLYLRKLAHPICFQYGVSKAKEQKPGCSEGPDSLITSTTRSQNRRRQWHWFTRQKRKGICLKGRT